MTCKQWQKQIYEYIEGTIIAEDLRQMEAHLEECQSCRQRLAKEKQLADLLRSAGQELIRQDSWRMVPDKKRLSKILRPVYWLPVSVLASFLIVVLFDSCPPHSVKLSPEQWQGIAQAFSAIDGDPQQDLRQARWHTVIINRQGRPLAINIDQTPAAKTDR